MQIQLTARPALPNASYVVAVDGKRIGVACLFDNYWMIEPDDIKTMPIVFFGVFPAFNNGNPASVFLERIPGTESIVLDELGFRVTMKLVNSKC